jgi:hypothetical protein
VPSQDTLSRVFYFPSPLSGDPGGWHGHGRPSPSLAQDGVKDGITYMWRKYLNFCLLIGCFPFKEPSARR